MLFQHCYIIQYHDSQSANHDHLVGITSHSSPLIAYHRHHHQHSHKNRYPCWQIKFHRIQFCRTQSSPQIFSPARFLSQHQRAPSNRSKGAIQQKCDRRKKELFLSFHFLQWVVALIAGCFVARLSVIQSVSQGMVLTAQ